MPSQETAPERKRSIGFGFPKSGKRFSFLVKTGQGFAGRSIAPIIIIQPARRLSH